MRSELLKNILAFLKKELNSGSRFSFENVSLEDVKKVTRELDITKTSQLLDIPIKIIKQNADFFLNFSLSILITLLTIVLFQSS